MLSITEVQDILNGVEPRSTGYQDGTRYWNLDMEFDTGYEQKFIARVLADGDDYLLVADTAEVEDHIAFSSMKPGRDNVLEEKLGIDMHGSYSKNELYREVCRALEPSYPESTGGTAEKAAALN
ncbi:MAG: hypothetical protein ABEI58_00165 [Candidatus Nanohaloarchaea archaeon]